MLPILPSQTRIFGETLSASFLLSVLVRRATINQESLCASGASTSVYARTNNEPKTLLIKATIRTHNSQFCSRIWIKASLSRKHGGSTFLLSQN